MSAGVGTKLSDEQNSTRLYKYYLWSAAFVVCGLWVVCGQLPDQSLIVCSAVGCLWYMCSVCQTNNTGDSSRYGSKSISKSYYSTTLLLVIHLCLREDVFLNSLK